MRSFQSGRPFNIDQFRTQLSQLPPDALVSIQRAFNDCAAALQVAETAVAAGRTALNGRARAIDEFLVTIASGLCRLREGLTIVGAATDIFQRAARMLRGVKEQGHA